MQKQRKLEELKLLDTDFKNFGAESHRYTFNLKIEEEEILVFENKHKIKLPENYRTFLKTFGNGGCGPDSGLFKLEKGIYDIPFNASNSEIINLKKDFKFDAINNSKAFAGNFHIGHQVYWSHSYKLNMFDFSLGWRFRTGIPYTKALRLNESEALIIYDKINNERLPNYHRLDFSVTYKFNFSKSESWKGKFGFSLLNIYNKKNILSKDYRIRFSTNQNNPFFLQETTKASLGVTPNLVFRVEF